MAETVNRLDAAALRVDARRFQILNPEHNIVTAKYDFDLAGVFLI